MDVLFTNSSMASLPKTDLSSSVFPGVAFSLDRVGVRQDVDTQIGYLLDCLTALVCWKRDHYIKSGNIILTIIFFLERKILFYIIEKMKIKNLIMEMLTLIEPKVVKNK